MLVCLYAKGQRSQAVNFNNSNSYQRSSNSLDSVLAGGVFTALSEARSSRFDSFTIQDFFLARKGEWDAQTMHALLPFLLGILAKVVFRMGTGDVITGLTSFSCPLLTLLFFPSLHTHSTLDPLYSQLCHGVSMCYG